MSSQHFATHLAFARLCWHAGLYSQCLPSVHANDLHFVLLCSQCSAVQCNVECGLPWSPVARVIVRADT